MEERVTQLEDKVKELEEMLSIQGMPYSLREIIRGEVIKGPFNLTGLAHSTYAVVGSGALVLTFKGREYIIPQITDANQK